MPSQPIFQFYAELEGYRPKMWRRFQVINNITMARLAYILMSMFEMQARHLFCLDVPRKDNFVRHMEETFDYRWTIGTIESSYMSRPEYANWHFIIRDNEDAIDNYDGAKGALHGAARCPLKNVLIGTNDRMTFTYDFGDDWRVLITLEKTFKDKALSAKELPRVIAGEGYGIIEDCDGVRGLERLAEAFKAKTGSVYQAYSERFGITNLDLTSFDIADANLRLKKIPRIYTDLYEYYIHPTKQSTDFLERKYLK